MTKYLFNNITLKQRRCDLRKNQTEAEKKLWAYLRNKQMNGLKFFRQYSIGPYILDFFCPVRKLGVELDGGHHAENKQKMYDEKRTLYLSQQGANILRFWDNEVLCNTAGVLEKIMEELESNVRS